MVRRFNAAMILILVHLLIAALHGRAHRHLLIPPSHGQTIFILALIFIAPLVAGPC